METITIDYFDNRKEGVSRFNAPPLHYTVGWREDKSVSVMITCPQGHIAYITHQINDNGVVHPSIVCDLTDDGRLGGKEHWHVWGVLKNWSHGFRRDQKQ